MIKILYGIQGTGNGHISRANIIIPLLQKHATVHVLLSGTESELKLPYKLHYQLKGLSFVASKNGGINLIQTYKKSNLKQLYKDVKKIPVNDYDIVISDFEPVTAWACKLHKKECIGLSHQAAVIHKKSPKPKQKDLIGTLVLKQYAPVSVAYGFHFKAYATTISTPVINSIIQQSTPTNNGTVVVYLPAYHSSKILKVLHKITATKWIVFSKNTNHTLIINNVTICPIDANNFANALLACNAVLTGAGFETPAEALYLKKKLLVIPMKGQYEQQCNAASLQQLGVPVLKKLNSKNIEKIKSWLALPQLINIDFPNTIESLLTTIIQKHS